MAIKDLIFLKQRKVSDVYAGFSLYSETLYDNLASPLAGFVKERNGTTVVSAETYTGSGNRRFGHMRLTSLGAPVSAITHNDSDGNYSKFHITADGGVVVATEINTIGANRIYKINSAGTKVWERSLSNSISSANSGAWADDSAGNLYYACMDFLLDKVVLHKYSSLGVLLWARQIDTLPTTFLSDDPRPIVKVYADNVYLTHGASYSDDGVRVLRIDTTGSVVWAARIPHPETVNKQRAPAGLFIDANNVCVVSTLKEGTNLSTAVLATSTGAVQDYVVTANNVEYTASQYVAYNNVASTGKLYAGFTYGTNKYLARMDVKTGVVDLRRRLATGVEISAVSVGSDNTVYASVYNATESSIQFLKLSEDLASPAGNAIKRLSDNDVYQIWFGAPEAVNITGTSFAATAQPQTITALTRSNTTATNSGVTTTVIRPGATLLNSAP